MENIGTRQQILIIDLIQIKANISELQFSILEILKRDLIRKQLIQGSIQDILDQILDWTNIGNALQYFIEHTSKNHTSFIPIINYYNHILALNQL